MLDATTVVAGSEGAVRQIIRRLEQPGGKSLQDSVRFQEALAEIGSTGELFAFVDLESLRKSYTVPVKTVSHVAGSLGVDGGLAVRVYAAKGESFPEFLVRTPRKKKFLARIPSEAVLVIGSSFDDGRKTRKKFADWAAENLASDNSPAAQFLDRDKLRLVRSFIPNRGRIESEAFVILKDMWFGVLPVKSETVTFIAPNAKGQWGAAALFDIEDKSQMRKLREKLLDLAKRADVSWKTEEHEGLKIRYIDFAEIAAKKADKPVPEKVAKLVQMKLGYAESNELFLIGSVDLIKFAHKPSGKTLEKEFSYEYLDEENAMLFSIRPGHFLHRTFGHPKLDDMLTKIAKQIPVDSSYSVTVNYARDEVTVRSSIPFTSLLGWLALEWMGKGPAKLKNEFEPPSGAAPEKRPPPRGEKRSDDRGGKDPRSRSKKNATAP